MVSSTPGSLTVVGIGINFSQHITAEARAAIDGAGKVFDLLGDKVARAWLSSLRPDAESLYIYYGPQQDRMTSYQQMVDRVLGEVRRGVHVVFVSYGHPGVFGFPMHESIRRARAENFAAEMLPGVSSIDCLFAELQVDPGSLGCAIFEASDFLVHRRKFDETSALILLQIGVIGMRNAQPGFDAVPGLRILRDRLTETYPASHEVIVFEAAKFIVSSSSIGKTTLKELPSCEMNAISTLYVPPLYERPAESQILQQIGWF